MNCKLYHKRATSGVGSSLNSSRLGFQLEYLNICKFSSSGVVLLIKEVCLFTLFAVMNLFMAFASISIFIKAMNFQISPKTKEK